MNLNEGDDMGHDPKVPYPEPSFVVEVELNGKKIASAIVDSRAEANTLYSESQQDGSLVTLYERVPVARKLVCNPICKLKAIPKELT
jgi:hypothetical protein